VRSGGLRSIAIGVTLAGLVFTACGDDKGPKLSTSRSTTTTSPATTTTTSPIATTTTAGGPTTVVNTTPPNTNLGTPKLSDRSTVTTAGLDVVLFGMTITQAEKAAGTRLLPDPAFPAGAQCIVLKPEKGVDGVWFTVSKGTIERVDVRPPGKVKTRSGATIGTTEAQLEALFPGRLTTNTSPTGKVIVYTPTDQANASYRVIFETNGQAVTTFRSGRTPQVDASNPC
jgi:hypothetical protein